MNRVITGWMPNQEPPGNPGPVPGAEIRRSVHKKAHGAGAPGTHSIDEPFVTVTATYDRSVSRANCRGTHHLDFIGFLKRSSTVKKNQLWPFRRYLRGNEMSFALDYAILVGVVTVALGVALGALSGNLDKIVRAIGG